MNEDADLNGALAKAMEAAATIAAPDRWSSLRDRFGIERAHQHLLEGVVAYRLAWEEAELPDSASADQAALAFANLETALRLAAPTSEPSTAILKAARACLRPWGLPSGKGHPAEAQGSYAPIVGAPPAARAMAVGGAYTDSFAGEPDHVLDRLHRILDDLVEASSPIVGLLVDANGQLLAASGFSSENIDTTSLACLWANDITSNLDGARQQATRLLWRGPTPDGTHHVRVDLVLERVLLVVIYEETHTGIVAVRARKAIREVEAALSDFVADGTSGSSCGSPANIALTRITAEHLRNLFGSSDSSHPRDS